MARDPDALKISKWAATGDVEDPEDGGIDRSIGWDISYSQPGGSLPKREHFNELEREVTALGVEVNVHGAGLEWDSSISYEHPALVTGSDARLYVSVQDSTNVDPVNDSDESHWSPLIDTTAGVISHPPNASATERGIVELATDAEVATGIDTTKAVTPAGAILEALTQCFDSSARYSAVGHKHRSSSRNGYSTGCYPSRASVQARHSCLRHGARHRRTRYRC